jgi:RimJ/RimL family protein N-acetyltransferase
MATPLGGTRDALGFVSATSMPSRPDEPSRGEAARDPAGRAPKALADLDWPLRTARMLIRPCRADDAESLYQLRTQPEVATWAHSVPTDLDDWRKRFTDPEIAPHVLTVEVSGEIVGELMAYVRDGAAQKEVSDVAARSEAELGWLIAPEHQGRGLATEAARALVALCFVPLGVRRVVASTFEANRPSWRVMEKVGMRLETRSRRDTLHRDRGWMDGRVYALLADD